MQRVGGWWCPGRASYVVSVARIATGGTAVISDLTMGYGLSKAYERLAMITEMM